MKLDRSKTALSLYLQIFQNLSKEIEDGVYEAGQIIPSEKQFQEEFGVSRMTIRLAIGELVNKGYVERMRGVGTFVIYGKIEEELKRVVSFSEEMQDHGMAMQTSHCEIKLINANEKIANKLNIDLNSAAYELIRVRCANNTPLVYSITYLKVPKLPLDPNLYNQSLYKFLSDKYNINISRARDQLEAILSQDVVSKFLELANGVPVFKRTRVSYDQIDNVVEYTVCYYPGNKYKYFINL